MVEFIQYQKHSRRLADKKGVNIFLNQKVDEIILENKEAKAIKVNDNIIKYDKIISNVDVNFTFKNLDQRTLIVKEARTIY
ncbi:MAG: hypothetical protein MZV64_01045 [Ignavibacteriales bacterium]|nr:hypothetical protein [Ignavibacteriales bacterium]